MSLLTPDSGLLFWMVIVFGIVFVILAKYGFPVITRMVDEAKKQIQAEKDSAISDIRRQVAVLSVDIAEKVLRKNLDDEKEQMEMIDRLLDELTVSKD